MIITLQNSLKREFVVNDLINISLQGFPSMILSLKILSKLSDCFSPLSINWLKCRFGGCVVSDWGVREGHDGEG